MAFQYIQYMFAGLLISLSGSLPLGNLNVSAMHVAARETVRQALWFALGVTVIEMAYLRFTLSVIDVLSGYEEIFYFLRGLTIVLLLFLAAGSFIAARSKVGKHIVLDSKHPKLLLGALMSLMNPLQVPFWMGWAIYLLSRSLLLAERGAYNIFTIGAGIGTFAALLVFIFAGRKFSAFMVRNHMAVNLFMGCLFIVMAVFQAVHFF